MSWILDVEGDLVNLDHVVSIMVAEDEDDPDESSVIAWVNDDVAYTLAKGSPEICQVFINKVWTKLPKVQP